MLINDLNISDGVITSIQSNQSNVKIMITDWQGIQWEITFNEVLAIQAFSIEDIDLSHVSEVSDDSLKLKVLRLYKDEEPHRFTCFNFHVVWIEEPLLKIIATQDYTFFRISES
ncbi:hypothetical protein A7P53_05140 [Acinetobacter defluvii]|uniref:hypothetical protein n=1 Tax=Acinetobacter defluvii TaxID=1871111 RepID=UPI0014903398|nr:hypothetical protein [Acinetobacter defluvii]NNP71855.1 hypothetical protein [Acinetobacter defluvii]